MQEVQNVRRALIPPPGYDVGTEAGSAYRLGLLTSQAFSIANFRGPLVREMVARGVTVYAIAPDYDEASRAAVTALGAIPVDSSMSRAGMNPLRDFTDASRLAVQLRRLRLDATFAYFIKPVIYGTIAARLAGVANRFVTIEGAGYVFIDAEKASLGRTVLRAMVTLLYKLALGQAKQIFMLNRDDQKLFVDSGMVATGKVCLIEGIGLDLQHYRTQMHALRPLCFLLIGRLLREKGVYDFIEAARLVKAKAPQARFVLVGSVDQNPGSVASSEVAAWVDEGIIEWPGQVTDVRTWIERCSVFVLPSYREGLPRSTQEAMAMGRAVITTDVPGCRETVVDQVNGMLVPVRDPVGLARAMMSFVKDPALAAKMGAESRRLAEERFDVHKINEQILTAMEIRSTKQVRTLFK